MRARSPVIPAHRPPPGIQHLDLGLERRRKLVVNLGQRIERIGAVAVEYDAHEE
jgi:hypothetical protein